jgi:serine/threonine-protein kinase RsbW
MDDVGTASITVVSNTENLAKVRDFMKSQVSKSPLKSVDQNKVILAVDEAVANIMRHAYQEQITGEIVLKVDFDPEKLMIIIQDSGIQFNPDNVKDVDIMEHVKRGRKTGLGIFLMRQIMDEVKYSFSDGTKNELMMIKYVNPPGNGEDGSGKGA